MRVVFPLELPVPSKESLYKHSIHETYFNHIIQIAKPQS